MPLWVWLSGYLSINDESSPKNARLLSGLCAFERWSINYAYFCEN